MAKIRLKKLAWALFYAALILSLLLLCQALLLPLGLAAALCYILLPAVKKLESWRLPSWLAILLVYLALFSGLAAILGWGVPRLWRDLAAIGQLLPETVASCRSLWQDCHTALPQRLGLPQLPAFVDDCMADFIQSLGDGLYNWLTRSLKLLPSLFSNLSTLIFAPVFAFYLLRDRQTFAKLAQEQLPSHFCRRLKPLLAELNAMLTGFVRGYLLVAVCVGLLFYLLLWLFGVDYSFTLGLIMAVAELIPYLGPLLAFLPCLLLVLVQGKLAVIKMLAIWLVVQQMENIVISPRIMAGAVRLHPLYIICAVLVGGYWFGVTGMIIAVPLAASLAPVANWFYHWWKGARDMEMPWFY